MFPFINEAQFIEYAQIEEKIQLIRLEVFIKYVHVLGDNGLIYEVKSIKNLFKIFLLVF